MNDRRHFGAVCAIALLAPARPATAADGQTVNEELARCAAICAIDARLACYDVLAGHTVAADRATAAASDPAPADRRRTAASQAPPGDASTFGLTKRQLNAAPEGPDSITAQVSKLTTDRHGKVYVSLDNGQTWTFDERDPPLQAGDTVTVRRAALGSFLMLTPSKHSYRVERVH